MQRALIKFERWNDFVECEYIRGARLYEDKMDKGYRSGAWWARRLGEAGKRLGGMRLKKDWKNRMRRRLWHPVAGV